MLFRIILLGCTAMASISEPDVINVHLLPHTHNDPGWLKTVDEYYYGSNSSIYRAGVQYILDSVLIALKENQDRKFVYVEMSFFTRWYYEQSLPMKKLVKKLVNSGQLSFANGGWVMHDEASAHYLSMIDQTTIGHKFLKDEFNYLPSVGWQLDPFGHSSTQAGLLGAELGFDSLFFGRIDYQDHAIRSKEKRLEFIWRGSSSLSNADIFTGVFSDGNYGPPQGFCFDSVCNDEPIRDNPALSDYNVDEVVERFSSAIQDENRVTQGKNIAFKMGSDFQYTNANMWFKNMDKLINIMNLREGHRFNVFYSNPNQYTLAKAAEKLKWTVKTDDFFPYADCSHGYWTGYYTSRPTLKYLERISASFLQTLKQLLSSRKFDCVLYSAVSSLSEAIGLVNHHDAITGTSKQHVADDYMKILDTALSKAEATAGSILFSSNIEGSNPPLQVCRLALNESKCAITTAMKEGDEINVIFYNPLPRRTTEQIRVYLGAAAVSHSGDVAAMILNDVGCHINSEILPVIPYLSSSSLSKPASSPIALADTVDAEYILVFSATIPALSSKAYTIKLESDSRLNENLDANLNANQRRINQCQEEGEGIKNQKIFANLIKEEHLVASNLKNKERNTSPMPSDLTVTNGIVTVVFDGGTGFMKTFIRLIENDDPKNPKKKEIRVDISHSLSYYKSFGSPGLPGYQASPKDDRDPHLKNLKPSKEVYENMDGTFREEESTQPSGAYIFRPSEAQERPTLIGGEEKVQLTVIQGDQVIEVHQRFSEWAVTIVRLTFGSPTVEFEYTVGPIPISDEIGKEVVSSFTSSLQSKGKIYTDSNGREFQERIRNFRHSWDVEISEPVAANYYPVTVAAFIKDVEKGIQMTVLTDRAQGVASIIDGEIEVMVHRRLLADDNRGVDEPLNETQGGSLGIREGEGIIVSGKHQLLISPLEIGIKEMREKIDQLYSPLQLFYGKKSTEKNLDENYVTEEKSSTLNERDSILGQNLITFHMPEFQLDDFPINIHLLTFEKISDDSYLLRLSHQFAINEDLLLSVDVDINLSKFFKNHVLKSVVEMNLSGNQLKSEMMGRKIHWNSTVTRNGVNHKTENVKSPEFPIDTNDDVLITLTPMQIRTFIVQTN